MESSRRIVPHSQSTEAPSFALAQPYFTSAAWHRRDVDLVFKRRWLFVGHVSQIKQAGDFFTYDVGKESVVIVRGAEGQIHAFHNSCRHRGSRICPKSSGNTKAFMCPNHAWTYELDGRLKNAPRMVDLDKGLYTAVPVKIEEWNGMLFINLHKEASRSVAEYLKGADLSKYALARSKVVYDHTYSINANWKLAAETYNECYHCALTHPELCALIDPLKDLEAWDDADAGDDYAIFTSDLRDAIIAPGVKTFSMDGNLECKKPLGDDGVWHEEIAALSWYPQFGIFVFPDHAVTYSWLPVAADQTLFRSTWVVHEDAREGADYSVERLIEFAHILNEQDTRVCENAQRGIESSEYRPGPYHPVFEGPLRGFNRIYLNQVGADPNPDEAL